MWYVWVGVCECRSRSPSSYAESCIYFGKKGTHHPKRNTTGFSEIRIILGDKQIFFSHSYSCFHSIMTRMTLMTVGASRRGRTVLEASVRPSGSPPPARELCARCELEADSLRRRLVVLAPRQPYWLAVFAHKLANGWFEKTLPLLPRTPFPIRAIPKRAHAALAKRVRRSDSRSRQGRA